IFSVSSTMWKVSELVFEGQSMISAIIEYKDVPEKLDVIRLQFDVLWSRIDIVHEIDFKERRKIVTVLDDLNTWRTNWDRVLFDPELSRQIDFAEMRRSLEPLVIETRRAWVMEFSKNRFGSLGQVASVTETKIGRQELMIAGLLALIVAYLVTEIYFGNLANRRERRLRDAADQANRIKSDFIANVSHEIRTPLNGIMNMASHLADQPLTPDQRQCISVIEDSGGLLLSTINDVLDLSKIEAGKMSIEYRDFDPMRGLKLARDLYRDQAVDKGIALELVLPSGQLPHVNGDERRFRQVLHNLVSNAIKFTASGSVRITAHYSDAGTDSDPAGALFVSVEDSGLGIAPDVQDRVFEPFGQAEASISREYGGTGLGLPISRSLCRAMQGDVTVHSTPGIGSRFDVFLPFSRSAAQTAAPMPVDDVAADAPLEGRVMIVDDNATNRFVLRTLLKSQPLELFEAESGMDALEQLATVDVDVVLMDVQMPGLNGMETTARLNEAAALAGTAPPPVIAVTANAMPHQVEACKVSGMVDVLPKPVSKRTLTLVLRRALAASGGGAAHMQDASGSQPGADEIRTASRKVER
ncbi:MAG: ATP-binding protein, partial [Pseudomonadota bacterium]